MCARVPRMHVHLAQWCPAGAAVYCTGLMGVMCAHRTRRRLAEFQHYKSYLEGEQGLWRQARALRTSYVDGKVSVAGGSRAGRHACTPARAPLAAVVLVATAVVHAGK